MNQGSSKLVDELHPRRTSVTAFSLFMFAGVVLSLILSACGGSSSSGGGTAASGKPTVVVGYEGTGGDPETVAIAQNLFSKDMNANVQLKYFDSGPAALSAIASGALQIMTDIGNAPTAAALARNVPLKIVYAQSLATTGEGLIVRDGAGINSVQDLKGKTIAVVKGSSSDFELNALLAKSGVASSSVKELNMAASSMQAAWQSKSINAVYVWNPELSAIQQMGGKILATDQDVKDTAPTFNLVLANSDWAKNNPKLVQGFIQAQDEALAFIKQHPDEAVQQMVKQSSVPADQVKTQLAGYTFYSAQDQVGANGIGTSSNVSSSLVATSLSASVKFLQQSGTITDGPSDLSQYIDPSYVENYLKQQ